MLLKLFTFLFFSSLIAAQDFADCEKEVLVLIDSWINSNSFSTFLFPLRERGYNLKFKLANDSSLNILRYGDYAFKNIIILAPNVRLFGGMLDVRSLVKFVEDGGNLFVSGDSSIGEAVRELAAEFGVEFDTHKTAFIDHFNYDHLDNGLHTRICLNPQRSLIKSTVMVGPQTTDLLLYEGISMAVQPANPLLIEVAWGEETSYSYRPAEVVKSTPNTVAESDKLIVAFQARNTNSRVVFTGSLKFLSDQFIQSPVHNVVNGEKSAISGNGVVAQNLLKWMVHEQGVLRVKAVTHHRVGEVEPPWEYTIKDRLHYAADIEFRNLEGKWVPFDANDVQLTLVRIDPFVRLNLPHRGNHYSVDLMLPDIYGVFKLVIDYRHTGYSYLHSVTQISIRPLKHTEYERFIVAAYPYYASAFSMLIGLSLFSLVYLYHMNKGKDSSGKSKAE